MKEINKSNHAIERSRERGVDNNIVSLTILYGEEFSTDEIDVVKYMLSKESVKLIKEEKGIDLFKYIYMIVVLNRKSNEIITLYQGDYRQSNNKDKHSKNQNKWRGRSRKDY